ncbi:unnamed protein product [Malus baccata var. baccata]
MDERLPSVLFFTVRGCKKTSEGIHPFFPDLCEQFKHITIYVFAPVRAGGNSSCRYCEPLKNIENICDVESHSPNSPCTCPKHRDTFDASVIWGLIGPRRLFGPGGLYRNLVWLFLVGAFLPVPIWVTSKSSQTRNGFP